MQTQAEVNQTKIVETEQKRDKAKSQFPGTNQWI